MIYSIQMTKKNNLFELIKSLTPTEKRHFVRSAMSDKDSKNYLRLFQEIDKLQQYDQSKIKRKFNDDRFIKQLHVMKIYLQDRIIRSLRNYHSLSSSSLRLKDMLKNIEIYFDKELYNLCALEIEKAHKLAGKYEDDLTLIEILGWKRKLAQAMSPGEFRISDVVDEQTAALNRLGYQNSIWRHVAGKSSGNLKYDETVSTLSSKVLSYNVQYREAITLHKNDEARKTLQGLVRMLERHPHRIEEEPGIYLSTVNNLISFFVFTKEYKAALKEVAKAKAFHLHASHINTTKNTFRLILRTYNIELEIYRDTEALNDAVSLINEINALLTQHKKKIPSQYLISLWFQFGYIFFLKKDFRNALHWINEIINSPFADQRKDLSLRARFLNLMVHYELKNFFVMRYFIGSTKRFFARNKAIQPYHKVLLAFFTKVSGAAENNHRVIFEKAFHDLFSQTTTMPAEELDYINWKKWIEDKIGSDKQKKKKN